MTNTVLLQKGRKQNNNKQLVDLTVLYNCRAMFYDTIQRPPWDMQVLVVIVKNRQGVDKTVHAMRPCMESGAKSLQSSIRGLEKIIKKL